MSFDKCQPKKLPCDVNKKKKVQATIKNKKHLLEQRVLGDRDSSSNPNCGLERKEKDTDCKGKTTEYNSFMQTRDCWHGQFQ